MDQPYNLNCYFLLCCYFRCIFIPRNYTFELLFYVFWELNAVIYKQSDYRDKTFSPYYFKYCTRGWCYPPTSRCSCVWYSRIYIKYWRSQTNLYFTINIIKSKSRSLLNLLSKILMEQQILCLICYYQLVCFL